MFCESCGTQIPEGKSFCPNCGTAVAGAVAAASQPVAQPAQQAPQPVAQPVAQPVQQAPAYQQPAAQPAQPVYQQPVAQPAPQPVYRQPAVQPVQPVYQQPVIAQPIYQQPVTPPAKRFNGSALAGLILSIISLLEVAAGFMAGLNVTGESDVIVMASLMFAAFILSFVGLIVSIVGMSKRGGKAMAIIGLILSICVLCSSVYLGITSISSAFLLLLTQ